MDRIKCLKKALKTATDSYRLNKELKRDLDKTGVPYETHMDRGRGYKLNTIAVYLWK